MRVADFDGDGIIDLLTLSGAGGPCYTLTVHWVGVADGRIRVGKWENERGDDKPFSHLSLSLSLFFLENSTNLSRSVKDRPLVLE